MKNDGDNVLDSEQQLFELQYAIYERGYQDGQRQAPFTPKNKHQIDGVLALMNKRIVQELEAVRKEIVKANIAGQAKWYVEDRMAELERDKSE